MHIRKILSQHRRDFTAVYVCEFCGRTEKGSGYDDFNFHSRVIPQMKCKNCGKVAGPNYKPRSTKYPEGMTV